MYIKVAEIRKWVGKLITILDIKLKILNFKRYQTWLKSNNYSKLL